MKKSRINLLFFALAITLGFHGALVSYTFDRTYDIFPHLFFADHYANHWFDHWSYLWYTGMKVTSYPPGTHQLIALISFVTGLIPAVIIVQILTMLILTYGIFRFSKIWVSKEAAGWATLFSIFLGSTCEAMHVFGQLPALLSLGIVLHAIPFVYYWVCRGNRKHLYISFLLLGAATAVHHVTPLFGMVFFITPLGAVALSNKLFHFKQINKNHFELGIRKNLKETLPIFQRSFIFGLGLIIIMITVVLPYWINSKTDPISQVPIPHISRDNFFLNTNALILFCLIPYGVLLPALTYLIPRLTLSKLWPLGVSSFALFIFGLGGTTPFARLAFGQAFDILTFDRFTLWATILLMPATGLMIVSLKQYTLKRILVRNFGKYSWHLTIFLFAASHIGIALLIVNMTKIKKMQPDRVEMTPIVDFLNKDFHKTWRYLALGFGDQMAWLSVKSQALTIDGNYHSARKLPELTSTPIERLDGSKFKGIPGIGSLQQFLTVPEKYNLKYIFSVDQFYDPLLYFSGWNYVIQLENNVHVWEKPDVAPLHFALPREEIPVFLRVMWGILPISTLLFGLSYIFLLAFNRRRQVFFPTYKQAKNKQSASIKEVVKSDTQSYQDIAFQIIHDLGIWQNKNYRYVATFTNYGYSNIRNKASRYILIKSKRIFYGLAVLTLATLGYTFLQESNENKILNITDNYFHFLDERHFLKAYDLLSNENKPNYSLFRSTLESNSGLTSSYSQIHDIEAQVREKDAKSAKVRSKIIWLTALKYHTTTIDTELKKTGNTWKIKYKPTNQQKSKSKTLITHPVVKWNLTASNRSHIKSFLSIKNDLDRPRISISSSAIVKYGKQYSMIGIAKNDSNFPAFITIHGSAKIFDENVQSNTQSHATHRLLPKSSTPFRINFIPLANDQNEQYYPKDFFFTKTIGDKDNSRTDEIRSYQLNLKAMILPKKRTTSIGLQLIDQAQSSNNIKLKIWNHSTSNFSVVKAVVGYFDKNLKLLWVDQKFVDKKITPKNHRTTTLRLPNYNQLKHYELNPTITINNKSEKNSLFSSKNLLKINHPKIKWAMVSFSSLEGDH